MDMNDMVLVSVDDHVVEPGDMWDNHLPAKYRDEAPKLVQQRQRHRRLDTTRGSEMPNVGLNAVAGRPPAEYGVDPTSFDAHAARLLRPQRSGCADMDANGVLGSLCFPSMSGFCGQLWAKHDDKEVALALLQAYNDWHIDEWCGSHPGRFIPLSLPALWARCDGRRDAPRRGKGMPRRHVLGEPRAARVPEPAQRALGPVLAGVQRRGGRRLHAHRLVEPAGDHRGRRADQRDDHPAADEPRAGGGRPGLEPGAAEVPRPALRHVRGRHRLDPVLPRALPTTSTPTTRTGPVFTSAAGSPRSCSRSGSSPASSTTPPASPTATC